MRTILAALLLATISGFASADYLGPFYCDRNECPNIGDTRTSPINSLMKGEEIAFWKAVINKFLDDSLWEAGDIIEICNGSWCTMYQYRRVYSSDAFAVYVHHSDLNSDYMNQEHSLESYFGECSGRYSPGWQFVQIPIIETWLVCSNVSPNCYTQSFMVGTYSSWRNVYSTEAC